MLTLAAEKKLEDLRRRVREKGNLIIAFSGGVDSGFLLKVAYDELGANVLAVMINSEIFPESELKHVKSFLNHTGIKHKIVQVSVLKDEDFAVNPYNRCYHCKSFFSQTLKRIAAEESIAEVAEGVTTSDLDEHRPGIAASEEAGLWHPLVEVGITKSDVRQMAKEIGLPFWDKPPNPCLATRIAFGERVTSEKLKMVEKAENFLIDRGCRQVRVRLHRGGIARIEVGKEELTWFFDTKKLEAICVQLKKLGFLYVTLDLEGYRCGSMENTGENTKR